MNLILASTSLYRRQLVERLRVPFTCVAPDVDETRWLGRGLTPRAVAEQLARAKAQEVAARHPGAIVIGSDQVAEIDGEILNKPGSIEAARAQLARLAGREHVLLTAVSILGGSSPFEHTDVTRLALRFLEPDEIARYVDADQPTDCAGAYKIESLGITLFDSIRTDDFTAITGLPLLFVARALRSLGFPLP